MGDLVLVMVNKVEADSVDQIRVEVDAKSPTANTNKDNLRKCHRQGKYTGIITEVHKGTYFAPYGYPELMRWRIVCQLIVPPFRTKETRSWSLL
ncbi:MAG: hypothetical protein ACLUTU_09720 [Blautia faecis]